jgi:hypothetical protein
MSDNLVFGLFCTVPLLSGTALAFIAYWLRHQRVRATWGLVVTGNGLACLFLVSVVFVAGEAYYRYFYDTTDANGYTRVCERWAQRYWHLNSFECRDDREYSYAIAPDQRRVTFAGDSFTTGHGIKRLEDRFANLIRRAHPEWEIHVLARNGLDTGGELLGLQQLLANGYKIDEFVLVYCLNDVADMMPEQSEALARIDGELAQRGWLRNNSYFADILYHRYKARQDPYLAQYFSFVRCGYQGQLWEQQKQRLKAFRDSVQSHGGHLSVVTFPFFQALGPNYEYQFVHDELNQAWRELEVPHLDLLPVYQGIPANRLVVNRFDPHPNEYANKLAAEAIDKFLRQTVRQRDVVRGQDTAATPDTRGEAGR